MSRDITLAQLIVTCVTLHQSEMRINPQKKVSSGHQEEKYYYH